MLSRYPWLRLIPLVLFLCFSTAVGMGLFSDDPNKPKKSRIIGLTTGPFNIPVLASQDPKQLFTPEVWKDQVVVLNVFASWCEPCAIEHPLIMRLAQSGKVAVVGIAWKDEQEKTIEYLRQYGNPYQLIGFDAYGRSSVPLGLSGVPETFVFNRKGQVVFNYKAALTEEVVNKALLPLIDHLLANPNETIPAPR